MYSEACATGRPSWSARDAGERLALEQLHDEVRDAFGVWSTSVTCTTCGLRSAPRRAPPERSAPRCRSAERAPCGAPLIATCVPRRMCSASKTDPHPTITEQAQELVLPADGLTDLDHGSCSITRGTDEPRRRREAPVHGTSDETGPCGGLFSHVKARLRSGPRGSLGPAGKLSAKCDSRVNFGGGVGVVHRGEHRHEPLCVRAAVERAARRERSGLAGRRGRATCRAASCLPPLGPVMTWRAMRPGHGAPRSRRRMRTRWLVTK